jgi:hypothetical protein
MLPNECWQFGNILLLSTGRISSFYWIRGSKHCFLTSFSNLNCNFHFLVFSTNRYLLVSSGLSWLHGNPISRSVFSYLWYFNIVHAPPHFWHTSRVFLKKDARRNLVLELVPVFFPRSAFRRRFLMQTSAGQSQIIPFLLKQYPQTDTFSCYISLY